MEEEKKSKSNKEIEEKHVEEVYELIATHFSETRYKPWPMVANFLNSFSPFSFVADVGCGNGKYANVNNNLVIHGSDTFGIYLKNLNN